MNIIRSMTSSRLPLSVFAPHSLFVPHSRSLFTNNGPLCVHATMILNSEPLRRKRRLDPVITRAREERKKRKIEKQIRRLTKQAKTLKPIDENETPTCILDPDEKKKHIRPPITVSPEVAEARILLEKDWARYKIRQYDMNMEMIGRMLQSQQRALNELRMVSEDLYKAAILPDTQLIPFSSHPPTQTPPIDKYESPDGEYTDISKKW